MNKKLIILLSFIVLLFIVFIFIYNKESSYEYKYEVYKYQILEQFDADKQMYTFEISDNNTNYQVVLNSEPINERELITNIKEVNNSCIEIIGKLEFYSVCSNGKDTYFNYEIIDSDIKKTYELIDVYNTLDKKFLIWNYDGFIYINDNKFEELNLFDKDTYTPQLFINVGDKLFVPDYSEKYYFSKFYLINYETGKYEDTVFNSEISFDSNFISYENDVLRIYDNKNTKAYDLNIANGDVKTINGINYEESDYINSNNTNYYNIKNNVLYFSYKEIKILLDDILIDDIIYQNNDEVVFISESKLYYFSFYNELTLLMENKEWQFNHLNLIHIY